jgi:hypothetical protein
VTPGVRLRADLGEARIRAAVRYGATDGRLQGLARVLVRGARATWTISTYHEFRDADPLAPGLTAGNSAGALVLGHDEGAYVFASGASLAWKRPIRGAVSTVTLRARRESAPRGVARAHVNDVLGGTGRLAPHDPVRPGFFVTVATAVQGAAREPRWYGAFEMTGGAAARARAWVGAVRRLELPRGFDLTVSGWVGAGIGDSLPQAEFRVGGARTLRGFPPGARRGTRALALGLDVGAAHRVISPIAFLDFGMAGRDGTGDTAASAGVGVSVLRGVVRANVARPLRGGGWRADVLLEANR